MARRAETAMVCCRVLAVKKKTCRPAASPCARAGCRLAAVLPEPVGASAIRFSPASNALRTASIMSFWPGRGAAWGKGRRAAAAAFWRRISASARPMARSCRNRRSRPRSCSSGS